MQRTGKMSFFWGKCKATEEGTFHSNSKTTLDEILRFAGEKVEERLEELQGKRDVLFVENKLPFGSENYYPESVYAEHTEYFLEKEKSSKEATLCKKKQAYTLRSSSAAHSKSKKLDEKPKWLSINSTHDEVSRNEYISRSLRVSDEQRRIASTSCSNWVQKSNRGATDECKRLEHILSIVQAERLSDIARAKSLLRADGDLKQLAYVQREIEKKRAERADWIMRILHDYKIISSAEMMVHLQNVELESGVGVHNVSLSPSEAKEVITSTLRGDWKQIYLSGNNDEAKPTCSIKRTDSFSSSASDVFCSRRRTLVATPEMQERGKRAVERRQVESRELVSSVYEDNSSLFPPSREERLGSRSRGRMRTSSRGGQRVRMGTAFPLSRENVLETKERNGVRTSTPFPPSRGGQLDSRNGTPFILSRECASRLSSRSNSQIRSRSRLQKRCARTVYHRLEPEYVTASNAGPPPGLRMRTEGSPHMENTSRERYRQWFGWGKKTSWNAERILQKGDIVPLTLEKPRRQLANRHYGQSSMYGHHNTTYSFLTGRKMFSI